MEWLSPAQLTGYLAFALGVACFLQKRDLPFKLFMAGECLVYTLHFGLLGEPTAVASSLVSLGRSLASIRSRSPWVAAFFVGLSAALGAVFYQGPASLLPIAASCIGTSALFLLQGLRMRLAMMAGTLLWVVNNLLVGSIGGTLLELTIAVVNSVTIWRLWRQARD
ncbi:MAG TPA: YgjV family protein [Burkholderiaceae bacterium]